MRCCRYGDHQLELHLPAYAQHESAPGVDRAGKVVFLARSHPVVIVDTLVGQIDPFQGEREPVVRRITKGRVKLLVRLDEIGMWLPRDPDIVQEIVTEVVGDPAAPGTLLVEHGEVDRVFGQSRNAVRGHRFSRSQSPTRI